MSIYQLKYWIQIIINIISIHGVLLTSYPFVPNEWPLNVASDLIMTIIDYSNRNGTGLFIHSISIHPHHLHPSQSVRHLEYFSDYFLIKYE